MKFNKKIYSIVLSSILLSSSVFAQNQDGEKFEVEPSLIQQISDGIKNAISSSGSTLDEVKIKLNSIQASLDSGALKGAKGDQGDVGPIGIPGVAGAKGDTGIQGVKGDTGLTGAVGANGPQGIQGIKGDTGATGTNGSQGIAGANGKAVVISKAAYTGVACPSGTGTTFSFFQDSDGNNIYTSADTVSLGVQIVCDGAVGATGVAGNNGSMGATGSIGPQGPSGATGLPGTNGKGVVTKFTALSVGNANCATGGSQVDFYVDNNNDGAWDAGDTVKIGSSQNICNGATGSIGSTGPQGSTGPTGAGCTSATGSAPNSLDITCGGVTRTITGAVTDTVGSITSNLRAGIVVPFAGGTVPTGWLLCDGGVYDQATYPQLYAAISTNYNSQTNPTPTAYAATPSATQFRVPDYRTLMLRGTGTNTLNVVNNLGVYQADMMQGHNHSISASYGASQTFSNVYGGSGISATQVGTATLGAGLGTASTISSDGTNGVTRSGIETRSANRGVNYIIKATDDTYSLTGLSLASSSQAGLVSRETSGTFSANFAAVFGGTLTIKYHRIGNLVTLYIPAMNSVASGSGNSTVAAAAVPLAIRNSVDVFAAVPIVDNAVNIGISMMRIDSTGAIIIYRNGSGSGTVWTTNANAGGWQPFTISYLL